MRTLLTGGVIVTCDPEHRVFAPGDLVFDEERIVYVGPAYQDEFDRRISVSGKLLMPGMINVHTHSGMTIFRSLADDVDLMVFLHERVWPREETLTPEDVYAGALLSAIEMLKSGVTSYVDMYFHPDALAQAALDAGIRALITPTILPVPEWEPVLGNWERQLATALEFCRSWEGRDPRITAGIGPHAPYTVPLEALSEIASAARGDDRTLNIHLQETRGERDDFLRDHGRGEIEALRDIGFFEGPVIAAHSVWVDDDDIRIYRDHQVGVAHCPQSNAKLGAGVAPAAKMLAEGINVGLGTDGAATNNNLALWEDLRLAPLLAKAMALDPKPLPAQQALAMATRLGARASRIPNVGVLADDCHADLVLINLNDTRAVPIFTPETYVSHLVYSMDRSLIEAVWVHGRQVVDAGQVTTVDEAEARGAVQRVAKSVSERAITV